MELCLLNYRPMVETVNIDGETQTLFSRCTADVWMVEEQVQIRRPRDPWDTTEEAHKTTTYRQDTVCVPVASVDAVVGRTTYLSARTNHTRSSPTAKEQLISFRLTRDTTGALSSSKRRLRPWRMSGCRSLLSDRGSAHRRPRYPHDVHAHVVQELIDRALAIRVAIAYHRVAST